jgi:hypothetical protein
VDNSEYVGIRLITVKFEPFHSRVQSCVLLSPNTSIQKRVLKARNSTKKAPETSEGFDTTWFALEAFRASVSEAALALSELHPYRLCPLSVNLDCSHKFRIQW